MGNGPATRILCLWLPDWPIQRIRLESPRLAGKAVALIAGSARTERVAACSTEARRLGASIGMKLADAQGLAGPQRLVILEHLPGVDRRALERLAAECERFSPTVSLDDSPEPDALLLNVTGLATLWGEAGEHALAEAVLGWAISQRLESRVAVAPTVGLALAAARFGSQQGASFVDTQEACAFASSLPVESLRIDETTLAALHQLGIDSIDQLLSLPRACLPSRFGHDLVRRLDQLLGDASEVVKSFRGEPALCELWEFESPVCCSDTLARVRRKLLERLSERMRRRRCGALRVLIDYRFDAAGAASEQTALKLFRPTTSVQELEELAALQVEGVRFTKHVWAIRILVGATAPINESQLTLFDNEPRDNPHALALLVNRLSGLVGAERVVRVTKRRSVDPFRRFALRPAVEHAGESFPLSASETERLRRLPLLLNADAPADTFEVLNTSDACVTLDRNQQLAVVRSWGPERIETGWWRGRGIRQDAYWVELADGSRLWICRELRTGRWSVRGSL